MRPSGRGLRRRAKRLCLLEVALCHPLVSRLPVCLGQQLVRLGGIRPTWERALQMWYRFAGLALPEEQDAEVPLRIRQVGVQVHGTPQVQEG